MFCPIQEGQIHHPQAVITKSVSACLNLATLHDNTCIQISVCMSQLGHPS